MEQQWRARSAWRNALVAVSLNLIGMPLEFAVIRTVPHLPLWPPWIAIGSGLVLLGVLLAFRHRPTRALGNAVFLLNVAAILVALWFIDQGYATSGRLWVPFQEFKLGMMTIALLAPDGWVGALCIAAYVIVAAVQLVTLAPEIRAVLALGEPWAMIAFGGFSAILLAYRLRRMALEVGMALARARIEATEHLARVLLAVRDLSNTPLQTIAFAAEAARERYADLNPLMDRVERSLAKLRALDRQLSGYDEAVRWTAREESLDARSVATGALRRDR